MINPLLVFEARAQARAVLYGASEFDLEEALRPLLAYALDSGIADAIGADAVFAIIRKAFEGIAEI